MFKEMLRSGDVKKIYIIYHDFNPVVSLPGRHGYSNHLRRQFLQNGGMRFANGFKSFVKTSNLTLQINVRNIVVVTQMIIKKCPFTLPSLPPSKKNEKFLSKQKSFEKAFRFHFYYNFFSPFFMRFNAMLQIMKN